MRDLAVGCHAVTGDQECGSPTLRNGLGAPESGGSWEKTAQQRGSRGRRKFWITALGTAVLLSGCDDVLTPAGVSASHAVVDNCDIVAWFSSFINPWATDPAWITHVRGTPHAGKPALKAPVLAAQVAPDHFLTDGRTFSANSGASSRMHSEIRFLVPRNGAPDPTWSGHSTGLSVGFEQLATTDTIVCTARDGTGGMIWSNVRQNQLGTSVYLDAGAADPCISGAPNIDYQGTLTLANRGTHVDVAFEGYVDGYPSYEMYARDEYGRTLTLVQHSNYGANPTALWLEANEYVSGNGRLCIAHDQGGG